MKGELLSIETAQRIAKLEKENKKLNKKLEQYENPDDMTLFYMWLDEKAKDKMRKLEQENKELTEENHRLRKIVGE